jgi:hypothetical protein
MTEPDTFAASAMLDALSETKDISSGETTDFLAAFDDAIKAQAGESSETPPAEVTPPVVETPPAAEAAQTDTSEDEEFQIELPKTASTASKDHFNKIKASAKTYKEEARVKSEALVERERVLAEKDSRIAELEKSVAKLPELEEKTKFVEEAERELALARVEGTQEYKNAVEKPLTAIAEAADVIAKANDIDFDKLVSVLGERDPAKQREDLNDIVAGLSAVDQMEVIRMAQDTRQLLTKQQEIRERAVEARRELEERTRETETKAQQQARETFEKAAKNAVEELKKRVPFIGLAEGETADAVFANFADQIVKIDLDKADPSTKAFAAASGVLLPRVVKQLRSVQAELETYKSRVKESTSTSPKLGGTATPPQRPDVDLPSAVAATLGLKSFTPSGNVLDQFE